jgi:hypothetical protein
LRKVADISWAWKEDIPRFSQIAAYLRRYCDRSDLAAVHVLRREAAPSPLVLQFVEAVFAIAPIAIQLSDRSDVVLGIGHQHRVFPQLRAVLDAVMRQRQYQLTVISFGRHSNLVLQAPTQRFCRVSDDMTWQGREARCAQKAKE